MTRAGEVYLSAAFIAVLVVLVAAPMALITTSTTPTATVSLPMPLDTLVAVGITFFVLIIGVLTIIGATFAGGEV
jgi:hypothetical protein